MLGYWGEKYETDSQAYSQEEMRLRTLIGNELMHSTIMVRNKDNILKPLLQLESNVLSPYHKLWVKMAFYNNINIEIFDEYVALLREDSYERKLLYNRYY